jgi:hypothetical protein
MQTMEKIKQYLWNPAVWISFLWLVFGLGVSYATLNSRISVLEKAQWEIDVQYIQTTLAQIQTDIQWIKIELQK